MDFAGEAMIALEVAAFFLLSELLRVVRLTVFLASADFFTVVFIRFTGFLDAAGFRGFEEAFFVVGLFLFFAFFVVAIRTSHRNSILIIGFDRPKRRLFGLDSVHL